MTITMEQFQRAVAERRRERKHGARKYEPELIAFAVEHARTAVEDGQSVHAAAKELGITMSTLQSWQQRLATSDGESLRRLRKVVVSEAQPKSIPAKVDHGALTLTTSSGHVVRGLSTAQVVALLRELP